MTWYELCVHTSSEASEAVSNILHAYTSGGIVIEDPRDLDKEHNTSFGEVYDLNRDDYPEEGVILKTYLSENPAENHILQHIEQAIYNLQTHHLDIGEGKVSFLEIDEEDWATAWKKYYEPVKISDKIMIVPTWDKNTPQANDMLKIELDPGMAFGTGAHPTTVLCIQALEQYVEENDVVMDIGSGSGVLSIASGLLGAKDVYAYDLDDIAVSSTRNNAALNQMDSVIHVKQNNLLEDITGTAQIIVSNILAEIIATFVQDAWEHLSMGGYFIASGIISEKRNRVQLALEEAGFTIEKMSEQSDWVVIIAQKTPV